MSNHFNLPEIPVGFFCDNKKSTGLRNEMIKNQIRINECEQGLLENVFFSDENFDLINKQLILAVYKKSQYKISPQSKQNMSIVMRYIFIEYAKNLPYDIPQQIKELNCKVISDVLPNIITNITQRIAYLKLIGSPRELLDLPTSTNNKNNQLLPSQTTIYM
jgi:hypothetical protein